MATAPASEPAQSPASADDLPRLVDTAPALLHTGQPDGSLDFFNQGWLDFLGARLDDLQGWRWTAWIHPDDVTILVDEWRTCLRTGEHLQLESRVRRADGQYRWFLHHKVPLRDQSGRIIKWYGASIDIEDRKRAEEALRRSEGYLTEGQSLTHTGSWAYNPSGVFDFWSDETYRIFGFDPTKPITLDDYLTHVHPEHRAETVAIFQKMVAEGCDCDHKYRVLPPGGELRFVRCVGRAVRENGVVTQLIGTCMDITEQEQMTIELRRSEAYLAEAQRLSHTGSFGWNISRNQLSWSDETFRIFEHDRTRLKPTLEAVMERVHPDDRKFVQEKIDRILRDRKGWDLEHRLLMPNGAIKHLHVVGNPQINEVGEIEFVGSVMDVTESKKALREIQDLKDRLYKENIALKEEVDQASMFEEIVGSSEPLRRVLAHVAKVAPTDSTVLITGETGTGKELVARAIHKRSPRSGRAFIRVNCGAIPQSLIGSELFGHEKGAFTGATQRRPGRFELADGGTLFLDEVGELPLETQVALLRVLQEREFERVGGCEPVTVDVRVLAATNRNLQDAVSDKTFREDLFYRLNVFPIHMPSLCERVDDIPLLIEYLAERYALKAGKKIDRIEKRTLELLRGYHWPGNIRELQNVIERAVILCDGEVLSVDETWLPGEQPALSPQSGALVASLIDQERQLIESALSECRGRVSGASGAAAKLGIPRSTLESRIRSLQIDKHRFRSS
jgi:PAS domain S-box-containing protein